MNQFIIHGDCLEEMQNIPDQSMDLIIIDPPYGTIEFKWDVDIIIPYKPMWEQIKRIRKKGTPTLIFGVEPFSSHTRISNIKEYRYDWYWEKDKGSNIGQSRKQPLRIIETISVFYKDQPYYDYQGKELEKPYTRVLPIKSTIAASLFSNNGDENNRQFTTYTHETKKNKIYFAKDNRFKKGHPTQKPVALLEYLIKAYTKENDTVLDFVMGSGSTGVACKNLNRKFIGIEKNEEYFNIAKERLNL